LSRFGRRRRRKTAAAAEPHLIAIPDEWKTSDVAAVRTDAAFTTPSGASVAILSVLLRDGSNIYVLDWGAGQRLCHLGAAFGFALEERYVGEPPAAEDADGIAELWRRLLASVIEAGHETEADESGIRARLDAAIDDGHLTSDQATALLVLTEPSAGDDVLHRRLDEMGVPR
jgi:hypothetical protein